MATLSIAVRRLFDGSYLTVGDLTTKKVSVNLPYETKYPYSAAGSAGASANLFVADSRNVAAASETIDFNSTLVDVLGNTANFATILEIGIHNKSTTATENLTLTGNIMSILVGNDAHQALVHPDGWWWLSSPVDGFAVTATSDDELTVDPGAATIAYDIFVLGVSA